MHEYTHHTPASIGDTTVAPVHYRMPSIKIHLTVWGCVSEFFLFCFFFHCCCSFLKMVCVFACMLVWALYVCVWCPRKSEGESSLELEL